MDAAGERELVLHGIFLHLVRDGFPLGVRDYLDALRALRAGYGGRGRAGLLWLCQALWARSEAESRAIRLLFDRVPPPTGEELSGLGNAPAAEPGPADGTLASGGRGPSSGGAREGVEEAPSLGVSFSAVDAGGVGLPAAGVTPEPGEFFVLTPQPVISTRALVVAWRRFRAALRAGPPVDLDLDATVAQKCRTGLLAEPVLVPARRNQARVVVLVDASPSMRPWRAVSALLAASLRQGRLGGWALYYFDNVPGERVWRDEALLRPRPLHAVLRDHPASTLLVVSDAGAARGFRNVERVRETAEFLARVRPHWRSPAWVNPMPARRWKGTSAEAVARRAGVPMFELTPDGLVEAVDVLRGRQPR